MPATRFADALKGDGSVPKDENSPKVQMSGRLGNMMLVESGDGIMSNLTFF